MNSDTVPTGVGLRKKSSAVKSTLRSPMKASSVFLNRIRTPLAFKISKITFPFEILLNMSGAIL